MNVYSGAVIVWTEKEVGRIFNSIKDADAYFDKHFKGFEHLKETGYPKYQRVWEE